MEVPFLSGTAFFSFSISTRGLASGCSLFFSFFILFFNWKEAKSEIADKESKRSSSYQYVGRSGTIQYSTEPLRTPNKEKNKEVAIPERDPSPTQCSFVSIHI